MKMKRYKLQQSIQMIKIPWQFVKLEHSLVIVKHLFAIQNMLKKIELLGQVGDVKNKTWVQEQPRILLL